MPWNKQNQSLINTSMWIKLLGKIELWQYSSYTSKCIDIPGNTIKFVQSRRATTIMNDSHALHQFWKRRHHTIGYVVQKVHRAVSRSWPLREDFGRYFILAYKILFVIRLEYIFSRSLEIRVTHRSSVNWLSFIVMEKHQTAICTELQPSTWKGSKKTPVSVKALSVDADKQ